MGHDRGTLTLFTGSRKARPVRAGVAAVLFTLGLMCLPSVTLGAPQLGGSGIDRYWGNSGSSGVIGGKFNAEGPRGLAVDHASGDVFAADTGNHRIQQFDGDGNFIRAWGQDVLSNGAGNTGFETCAVKANCKAGVSSATGGAMNNPAGLAVSQITHHVYVVDSTSKRVQEFRIDDNGTPINPADDFAVFVRAFGQDVIVNTGTPANSNGTGYEVCDTTTVPANSPADCKAGTSVGSTGGVLNLPVGGSTTSATSLTVAPDEAPNEGDVLVADPNGARVQEFTASGAFFRAFGGGVVTGGAAGIGNLNSTTSVAAVKATSKAFAVGQEITGDGIQPGTTITALGSLGASFTLTLSKAATKTQTNVVLTVPAATTSTNVPINEKQRITLGSNTTGGTFTITMPASQGFAAATTAAGIAWDASPGAVQSALEGLAPIGAGNIEVTSANPGGGAVGGPYTIEFKGKFADTNVANLTTNANGLTVSSGTKTATRTTPVEGASSFEICTAAGECQAGVPFLLGTQEGSGAGQFAEGAVRSIAEDDDGNLYTVEAKFAANEGTSNFRVQKFTLPANVVTPQGTFDCSVLCGTKGGSVERDNPFEVAVDTAGYLYVTKAFLPGMGTPPVQIAPFNPNFQHRVLKVDPQTGLVLRVFFANAGNFNRDNPAEVMPVHNGTGLTALAVGASGLPLYTTNTPAPGTASAVARIYRVDEIDGLTATLSKSNVTAAGATLEAAISPADIEPDTFYRFEYSRAGADDWSEFRAPVATTVEDVGVDIGNGSDGGESSECSPNAGKRAALCNVSQVIDGLERDRVYEFRLVATTEASGLVYTSDPVQFETAAAKPAAATGVAIWSGPPATGPSLTFNGTINPQGDQTSFRFEYGDQGPCSTNPCESAPAFARDIGHGAIDLEVSASVNGLDPNVAYDYRIVAANSEGTSFGADRIVAPPTADDRFVELVSDGDSHGTGVYSDFRLVVSDDGDRAAFSALAFGEQESSPSLTTVNVAERGGGGWEVASMAPDPSPPTVFRDRDEISLGADVSHLLWLARPSPGTYRWMSRGSDGGYEPVSPPFTAIQRTGTEADRFVLRGASLDQSTIVFANNSQNGGKTLLADEPLVVGGGAPRYSNLYAIEGAGGPSPTLSVVNRGTDGKVIGGSCGARLGAFLPFANDFKAESTRAVSSDGSVTYFSARPGNPTAACEIFIEAANPVRVFKRIDGTSTVEVSACAKTVGSCTASGDDYFSGASADGGRVYFTSPRQLLDGDTDSGAACSVTPAASAGCDLYLYDAAKSAGERLTEVSAGPSANVLGVLDVSMDGSRAYFVAEGVLAGANGEGASPQANKPNLYVFERGSGGDRVAFVATLSGRASSGQTDRPDRGLWSQAGVKAAYALPYYSGLGAGRSDGNGHLLLFDSEEQLLPAVDTDSVGDVYRYDDTAPAPERLSCLSCGADLPFPAVLFERLGQLNSSAATVQQQRVASEDGSAVVFNTREQLLPEDTNPVNDVYLWKQGEGLSLASAATGSRGVQAGARTGGQLERELGPVISPDGNTVFFLTRATILPQDRNNGAFDWYAARVGGGFPQPEGASDPCKEIAELCQGSEPPSTPNPGPVSSEMSGGGNPQPRLEPKPCPKGKHRVKGPNGKTRCVPNKPHKGKKQGKHQRRDRANSDRRAGR
jgi:NHL repeat